MARIFNIYFNYDNAPYNAIVSVRTTPFFTEFTLNNFDEELLGLLPGNKIISTGAGNYRFQHAAGNENARLMNVIIRAVAEHYQGNEVKA